MMVSRDLSARRRRRIGPIGDHELDDAVLLVRKFLLAMGYSPMDIHKIQSRGEVCRAQVYRQCDRARELILDLDPAVVMDLVDLD